MTRLHRHVRGLALFGIIGAGYALTHTVNADALTPEDEVDAGAFFLRAVGFTIALVALRALLDLYLPARRA